MEIQVNFLAEDIYIIGFDVPNKIDNFAVTLSKNDLLKLHASIHEIQQPPTSSPPTEPGWNKLKCPACGGPGGLTANGIDYQKRICQNNKCPMVSWTHKK